MPPELHNEEALRGATNPDEFRLRLAGIQNTSNQAKEEMEKTTVGNVSELISRMQAVQGSKFQVQDLGFLNLKP